jgi:hypothetical protein
VPHDPHVVSLVIGPQASGFRRKLSPAAWMVLEEMVLRSTAVGDCRIARVSVRSLAGSLGMAKDTVLRAIGRLRAAGVVTGVQQRTAAGVFDTGVYVITVCSEILAVRSSSAKPPRRVVQGRQSQLALALES